MHVIKYKFMKNFLLFHTNLFKLYWERSHAACVNHFTIRSCNQTVFSKEGNIFLKHDFDGVWTNT